MKKLFLVLAFIVFTVASVKAQSNAIKVNPLSAFLATINLSYETKLSDQSTAQLGVFYSGVSFGSTRYTGIGITPEYRMYVGGGEALDGLYVAPFLRYQNFTIKETETDSKGSLSTFGGGVILGRQWILGEAFTLDLFIGPSYSAGDVSVDAGDEDTFENTGFFNGVGVRWGVTLGYAF